MLTTVMVLLTAGYCGLLWLALGAYQAWLPFGRGTLGWFTTLTVSLGLPFPWQAAPWQVLAVASLAWVLLSARRNPEGVAPLRGWVFHMGWLLLSVFAIGVGMLLPIVQIGWIIR